MRWLLRLLVSDEDRRAIENDLSELHEVWRRQYGVRAANRWLRRQRLLYPWHILSDRVRAALPGWTTMSQLWRDVRYSLRSVARVPVLAVTIVLTIGVGRRPVGERLAYQEPGRLPRDQGVVGLGAAILLDRVDHAHGLERTSRDTRCLRPAVRTSTRERPVPGSNT